MKAKQTAPRNIDAYIAAFPKDVQAILQKVRATIKKTAPGAQETIKYQIPTFTRLISFAGYKRHIGFYPGHAAVTKFSKELSAYKHSVGSVQFPLDKPIPYGLIRRIVRFRIQASVERAAKGTKQSRK